MCRNNLLLVFSASAIGFSAPKSLAIKRKALDAFFRKFATRMHPPPHSEPQREAARQPGVVRVFGSYPSRAQSDLVDSPRDEHGTTQLLPSVQSDSPQAAGSKFHGIIDRQ